MYLAIELANIACIVVQVVVGYKTQTIDIGTTLVCIICQLAGGFSVLPTRNKSLPEWIGLLGELYIINPILLCITMILISTIVREWLSRKMGSILEEQHNTTFKVLNYMSSTDCYALIMSIFMVLQYIIAAALTLIYFTSCSSLSRVSAIGSTLSYIQVMGMLFLALLLQMVQSEKPHQKAQHTTTLIFACAVTAVSSVQKMYAEETLTTFAGLFSIMIRCVLNISTTMAVAYMSCPNKMIQTL
ncbi:uroporphyrinogen decarboxylase [Acrasis kona]|uniref:Uroporphyrinogen decarboxylase n=1 Tax=Acrasis kona TaxID=1008807 RepID=A0AAW2YVY8_9EUKA